MKKIFVLFLTMFIATLTYASPKRIADIRTMRFVVLEDVSMNKSRAVVEYQVVYERPDKMKQVMTKPDINKGETYIYKNGEKYSYLPVFNQRKRTVANSNENAVIAVIERLLEEDGINPRFREEYYDQKVTAITLDNGVRAEFRRMTEVDGYLIPCEIAVFEQGKIVGAMSINNIQINPKLSSQEFEIGK